MAKLFARFRARMLRRVRLATRRRTARSISRMTQQSFRRLEKVLKWRREGMTLEEIGRELKVTRERVRQLEHLAKHLREHGKL